MNTLSFEITEEYILSLIKNQIQESINLDYKSQLALSKRNIEEITKDITSFANSVGGVIIYGVAEKDNLPSKIDGDSKLKSKRDWLNQIINQHIHPRILGIKFHYIEISSEVGKAVLVVEIPESYTAHQANDYRYWARYGQEKREMYDYQVRQTMNKRREAMLKLKILNDTPFFVSQVGSQLTLELQVHNVGFLTAKSCYFEFYLPSTIENRFQGNWFPIRNRELSNDFLINGYSLENLSKRVHVEDIKIHPGQKVNISGASDSLALNISDEIKYLDSFDFYYAVFAENMKPNFGYITTKFEDGLITSFDVIEIESLPWL